MSFVGHSVLTFDANEQCYLMHWWDSMGYDVSAFKGAFAGDTLTMSRREARREKRVVWEFPDSRTYRFRMKFSQDGNQWHPLIGGK